MPVILILSGLLLAWLLPIVAALDHYGLDSTSPQALQRKIDMLTEQKAALVSQVAQLRTERDDAVTAKTAAEAAQKAAEDALAAEQASDAEFVSAIDGAVNPPAPAAGTAEPQA